MKVGKEISRLALAALVAIAVVAPAAHAMPAPVAEHGSPEQGQAYDVNRVTGEYMPATSSASSDLRTEGAKGPGVSTPPVGLPTWPEHPVPIVPTSSEPVVVTDTDGGSFDWPLAALIAGGVIALAGAALVGRHQLRLRPAA